MAIARPVRWAFFPLDEQLGLRSKVGFTPRVEEGMARLGTWMPFRAARRELAFFLGVEVAEASVRALTEQAGATQVEVQAEEVAALLTQRPESPTGPEVQLLSVDGALIQVVSGEWKEVKTLAVGVVGKARTKPGEEERVQTRELSYFSRMSEAETFQQETLGEVYRRGVEKATTVCAVSDGAGWIQKWVDYHRSTAVRILDFAHALEYVSAAGHAAYEHLPLEPASSQQDPAKRRQERFEAWLKTQAHELKTGAVAVVLVELERLRTSMQEMAQGEAVQTMDKSLYYLRQRQEMMQYAHFQAQGYPIGSGSVESANKLVVQSRMKQAGMRWEATHVNSMLAMRNLACNERWQEGWLAIRQSWQQQRQTARAQRAQRAPATRAAADPLVQPGNTLPVVSGAVPIPVASSSPAPSSSTAQGPILPRGSRQAGTHSWQRPFLPRRSA